MNQTLDIIRRLRALPMTQAEISRHTGISQSRICRWEAGKIPVGADDALNLQRLLAAETIGASPAQAATETIAKVATPESVLRAGRVRRRSERRVQRQRTDSDRRAIGGPPYQINEVGEA